VNVNAHGEPTRVRLREIEASVSNGYEAEYRELGWSKALHSQLRDLHFLLTFFREADTEQPPAPSSDARELVEQWKDEWKLEPEMEHWYHRVEESLIARITTHANQRYREGLEDAATAVANEAVDADSSKHESDYAYNRALEHAAEAIHALKT
jgi:hypothetical protein